MKLHAKIVLDWRYFQSNQSTFLHQAAVVIERDHEPDGFSHGHF